MPQVPRSLQMSDKSLAIWVGKAKRGQPLQKRPPARPVEDGQAESARLRREDVRLKLEKGILKEVAAYFAN